MYIYYLAYDDGNMLIRSSAGKPIQRFDIEKQQWIVDYDMCQIYFGKIPMDVITEKKANEIINSIG